MHGYGTRKNFSVLLNISYPPLTHAMIEAGVCVSSISVRGMYVASPIQKPVSAVKRWLYPAFTASAFVTEV